MDAETLTPATTLAKKAKTPFPGAKRRISQSARGAAGRRDRISPPHDAARRTAPGAAAWPRDRARTTASRMRTAVERRPARPVRRQGHAGHLFLDVRAAARAALPDVHQLARRGERQRRRHQAARRAQDPGPLARSSGNSRSRRSAAGATSISCRRSATTTPRTSACSTPTAANTRRWSCSSATATRCGCSGPAR